MRRGRRFPGSEAAVYLEILQQAGLNGDGFCIPPRTPALVAFATGREQIPPKNRSKIRPQSVRKMVRRSTGRPQQGFSMAEKLVAKTSEMKDGDRRIVFVGDQEIGVFRHEGQYYAYSNFCLHQGGPACEGLTIAKVEERLRPDMTSQGLYFSETQMNFVCPWHGMEYDMKTGECISDRKMKLKKYQVLEKGDEVYVVA
jgi:nitrite reductase/ring-hydroxylating ferredoxin subunit